MCVDAEVPMDQDDQQTLHDGPVLFQDSSMLESVTVLYAADLRPYGL